uniref:Uncharacterized protein n=1 Tax=Solibacter usitatus (strain Ellin6076) TaxID=234267 RepID=Q01SX7_SOLUE
MSKKYSRLAAAVATTGVQPHERDRIAQLIASNRSDSAVDAAKAIHKRCNTPESESLLLDAYGARVRSLLERRLDREAAALMDLVRERYPAAAAERLKQLTAVKAARNGDLSALLEPLKDPSLQPEKQAEIATLIRRNVVDLRALAECQALNADHPLRIAAAALWRAFEAVTSGPVPEEALALPEVARSSPLAPWKLLVRAIAAYYRKDDELCAKCLAAIEADSAAARLSPPLRKLIHLPQNLTPAALELVNRVDGNFDFLRTRLKALDSALDRGNRPQILDEIRNAVAACSGAVPELMERLRQHISVRSLLEGLNAGTVASAMGGSSLKNAHFWRLRARAHEEKNGEPGDIALACSCWEEFRKHAIREGWFPAKGPEVATLHLHMADLLQRLDEETLRNVRYRLQRQFDFHKADYRDQPPVLRILMPTHGNLAFLDSGLLLERACQADPCRENFARRLAYCAEIAPETCDTVAEQWAAALPRDITPLLHLMRSAEQRDALQKAFGLMERAEKIDGVNPDVRRARLRLLAAIAVRHLRQNKPKLADKDLSQIEALPQSQQGDRPAFVAALRFVWCLARNAKDEADAAYAAAVRVLGDEATTQILFIEAARWCGRSDCKLAKSPRPRTTLVAALGRICALADDVGMELATTADIWKQLETELSAPKISVNPRALEALGNLAMAAAQIPIAYALAGAGLAQGTESHAQFLFLRAQSLPPWEDERRDLCLAAAAELARRRHDSELLTKIGLWRQVVSEFTGFGEFATAAPGTEEIGRLVEREIGDRDYPGTPPDEDELEDDEDCPCPACCAKRGQPPPEIREMVEQLGPDAVMQALAEILGGGGRKKRGRGRGPLDDLDVPL